MSADLPDPLTGLDAELYDALAECGRIVEAMPWDERKQRVAKFLSTSMPVLVTDKRAFDLVVGVMVMAHQRRLFDQEWAERQDTSSVTAQQHNTATSHRQPGGI